MSLNLQRLRKNAGYITQEALAEAIGKKRSAIAKWETGAAYPRPPTITQLAETLNTTEGEIIDAIKAAKIEKSNRPNGGCGGVENVI